MNRTLGSKAVVFATACLSISLSLFTLQTNAGQKSTWNRNVAEVDGYGDDDEGDSAGAPAKAAASRNEDDFM